MLLISRNNTLRLKLISASKRQKRRNINLNYTTKQIHYIAENYICAVKETGDLTLLRYHEHTLLSYNLLLFDKEPILVKLFQNLL
jgi:hypothetical protein